MPDDSNARRRDVYLAQMRIGALIFPTDKGIQPVELGRELEARKFDSVWFPEHSHIPSARTTPWGGQLNAAPLPEQ